MRESGVGSREVGNSGGLTSIDFITHSQSNLDQMPPLHLRHSEPAYREDVQ